MFWMTMAALAGGDSAYSVLDGNRAVKDMVVAVKSRKSEYEACFKGDETVKMHVTVSPAGEVVDAKFSLTDVDQEVAACLTRATRKLRFAPGHDTSPTTFQWMATRASLDENYRGERPDPGDVFVRGGLTKDQVREVAKRNHAHFSYCFRKMAAADHGLTRATLDLHVGVDPTGKVSNARGMYSDVGEEFATCIGDRAMQISFPAPTTPGITDVIIPMEFTK